MIKDNIYYYTDAICNICKNRSSAKAIKSGDKVFLEKFCPDHGFNYDLLSSDVLWFENSLQYIKPKESPKKYSVSDYKGCPDSCGFCPEHQQHVCLPVIEITSVCDLVCPVCLKKDQDNYFYTYSEFEKIIDNLIASEENLDVINLSGGEPTLHPNIIEFINLCNKKNIAQTTVSTNGLKLLKDIEFRQKFKDSGAIAAIQFDGFSRETYLKMRGEDLLDQKIELINILTNENIPFSLVATIAKNLNDNEIQKLSDFLFESSALSLMIQPLCFTGSAANFDISHRYTISDVVHELEKSKYIKKGDFNPLPCSHYSCFALSYYINGEDGNYYSLIDFLGKENFLDTISNKTLPGLDYDGFSLIKDRLYQLWSAADSSDLNDRVITRIQKILRELNTCGYNRKSSLKLGMSNMKAIFIHHFMDAYNFEFGRVIKCCNPYPQKDGRFIPICVQNVFY